MQEPAATNSTAAQDGSGSPPRPIIIAVVGERTRNVDPDEYKPHHVAIGPYHRVNDPDLARDDEKKRSLRTVLAAASPNVTVKVYLEELEKLRDEATRCYEYQEFEGISSNDFVRMLMLDACYLLAFFGDIDKYVDGRPKNNESTVVSNGHEGGGYHSGNADKVMDIAAVRDVFFLAENQVPFFIIDRIYRLSNLEGSISATDALSTYVRKLLRKGMYSVATPNVHLQQDPGNLLHLLHMHLQPTEPRNATTSNPVGRWRTATDYYFSAGVSFKNRPLGTDGCQCILDVRLVDGGSTLEIPCLNIDDNTWRILRNLVALEQHNSGATGTNFTAYCVFMSQLACNESDVKLLSRRGVISHCCGNHVEVAKFFTDLCKGILFNPDDDKGNYLKATFQALEKRCHSRHQRWMAWLRQKYFKNPWLTVGLAAAAIGLACAVVQAVYSVLSYKH
ncbi:hypothetical protein EJB05_49697, partial [Eragrostis curvula]